MLTYLHGELDRNTSRIGATRYHGDAFINRCLDRTGRDIDLQFADLDDREIQQVIDDMLEMLAGRQGTINIAFIDDIQFTGRLLFHEL